MTSPRFLQQVLGVLLVAVLLKACAAPTPTLAPPPTFPPPPPPPHPTFTSPATLAQPTQPTEQPSLFKFIQTVQVAPDEKFSSGGFVRVNYLPAIDHFVVTFGTRRLPQTPAGCQQPPGIGYVYKEYDLSMNETGKSGIINCESPDFGGAMVGNNYYFVNMSPGGWHIIKYDAVNWKALVDISFPLDQPREMNGDPMLAFVNGQIDVSSAYSPEGNPPGTGSHHQLFTPDLKFIGKKTLTDIEHGAGSAGGAYEVYVDGVYHFITSSRFDRDVIVLQYDNDWKYLGAKTLIKQAHFPTGVIYDGQRFYVAYLNTSQRTTPGFLPIYPNVHLAAFDKQWNLIDDIAVTNYTPAEKKMPGRPWVSLHGNRLYVSYDLGDETLPFEQGIELMQAYVSIFELTAP